MNKEYILNSLDTAYDDFICKSTTAKKANVNENSCYRDAYNWIIYLLINMSGDQLEEFYNNLCNVTVTREIDNGGVLFKILLNTKNKEERSWYSRWWNDPSFEYEKWLFEVYGKEKYKKDIDIPGVYKRIFSSKFVRQSICDSLKKIMLESIDVKNKCQICLSISTIEKDLDKSVFRVEKTDKDDINENVIKKFMIVLTSYYNDLYKIVNTKIKGGAR